MDKGNTIRLAPPRKITHRSIHDFQVGDKVGRFFDDGDYYTARIMSEPKLLKDEGKKRFVCTRRIKYFYDNQVDDADEEQLNEWSSNETYREDSKESWLVLGKGRYSLKSSSHDIPEGIMTDDDGSFFSTERLEEDDVIRSSDKGSHARTEDSRFQEGNMVTPPPTKMKPPSLHSQENAPKRRMDNTGQRKSKRSKSKPATMYSEAMVSTSNHASSSSASTKKKSKKIDGIVKKTKEEAKKAMMHKMGTSEEEIDSVLEEMASPYELNEAYNTIIKKRQQGLCKEVESSERFYPKPGLRVRVPEGGWNWHGTVISDKPTLVKPDGEEKAVEMWTVEYDEGGEPDQYCFHELRKYRADRPVIKSDGCLGRTLNALELFAGSGIVSQEFCQRNFQVKSIDINPSSNATNVLDILNIEYDDIGFVPDFIWASPPCTTYSNVTCGHHRDATTEEFAKTPQAYHDNYLLLQMMGIMRWAKSKNPHLIVAIENPNGLLQKMPMMNEFERTFGLHKALVDYCAFDEEIKKPTNIWTNDYQLSRRLSGFRCSESNCPFFGKEHPVSVCSKAKRHVNVAAIPRKLAELVAHYVDAKFFMNDIRMTPKVILSADEVDDFNLKMS